MRKRLKFSQPFFSGGVGREMNLNSSSSPSVSIGGEDVGGGGVGTGSIAATSNSKLRASTPQKILAGSPTGSLGRNNHNHSSGSKLLENEVMAFSVEFVSITLGTSPNG